MGLAQIDRETLHDGLNAIGIGAGDGLLVHSALQFLGQPQAGEALYLQVIEELIGEKGTLAVPAFTFAFARGQRFDPAASPSEGMGAFSELVRQDPRSQRIPHPMQSLALIGARAQELAALDTPSAFDDGSAFARMLQLDFKLLLLGADIQAASIVHYSEQRAAVPYRYWKDFSGEVRRAGRWTKATYRMFVRDLELDPQLALAPIQQRLEAEGQWRSTPLNYGRLASCSLRDFVNTCDALLAADPWALVANRESLRV